MPTTILSILRSARLFVSPTGGVSGLPFDPSALVQAIWNRVDAALANPNDPLLDRTRGGISVATLVGIASGIEKAVLDGSSTGSFSQSGLIVAVLGALVERSGNATDDPGAKFRAATVNAALGLLGFGFSVASTATAAEGVPVVTLTVLRQIPVVRNLIGSFAAGWSFGSYVNSNVLSEETKEIIGDTLYEAAIHRSAGRLAQRTTPDRHRRLTRPNDKLSPNGFGTVNFCRPSPFYRIGTK